LVATSGKACLESAAALLASKTSNCPLPKAK
jgi:hypothetical protein